MDNNTVIILVALLFIILIICGFLLFRRRTKVGIELPGSKLSFEGSNDPSSEKSKTSKGILRNVSLGKTQMEIKGTGTIADNISAGDTELRVEDTGLKSKKKDKQRRKK